eukprot:745899-Hanusia_phi.AAC.1
MAGESRIGEHRAEQAKQRAKGLIAYKPSEAWGGRRAGYDGSMIDGMQGRNDLEERRSTKQELNKGGGRRQVLGR